ncbi:lysine transporter LysE [Aureitalea marina]|uniref:Lysine transporter LysE n=1 Tax=Aureitalea marina TaxID=930804 RepID=A0A2S7KT83_9FLAO|nr:lysine transporter LysE [Aureitalea marina]PQB05839.1 lysine transporter LysE [Aureitalea marina]
MSLLYNAFIAFFGSMIGVIPPGLLNMSAAKISMESGRKSALLFSSGVALTVCIQTCIALLFARYLDRHPEVIDLLQKVALGIFFTLTIYFFFFAKDTRQQRPKTVNRSGVNRFFYGMFLAALNLLPLPYWVYISITLNNFGWFSFDQSGIAIASIASGAGTFTMLSLYSRFFRTREEAHNLRINMNYIIGLITATITVVTLVKIIRSF